jgi:hypothetical protein
MVFPSGVTLAFGYLADYGDLNRYSGNSSFIGYEANQFGGWGVHGGR